MRFHVFLASALLACGASVLAAAPEASPPSVLVTTTPLKAGSLPQTVLAWGTMLSPPSATQVISARTTATVGAIAVHVGDDVRAGAPLLQLVPDAQTAASYAQAQTALRDAEQVLARTRDMLAQHLATAQQLDAAQKTRADARATLEALKTQGAGGAATLRAPFRAIVTKVTTARGALVAPGAALLELARAEDLTLRVNVTPEQARQVAPGDPVQVSSLDGKQHVAGKVARRGATLDAATGLVPVDISVAANPLFAGENAQAVITVGAARGYVVPHAAILLDAQGQTYVVQVEGDKARKVTVQIATSQGARDLVQGDGLKAGQPLVLEGNYQLDDGMAVRWADKTGVNAATAGAQ